MRFLVIPDNPQTLFWTALTVPVPVTARYWHIQKKSAWLDIPRVKWTVVAFLAHFPCSFSSTMSYFYQGQLLVITSMRLSSPISALLTLYFDIYLILHVQYVWFMNLLCPENQMGGKKLLSPLPLPPHWQRDINNGISRVQEEGKWLHVANERCWLPLGWERIEPCLFSTCGY